MGGAFIPGTDTRPVYFGPHRGIHRIFDNLATFRAHFGPDIPVVMKWWESEAGDWFLTTDGHVAQCLKRTRLVNRRGQVTIAIKTCFGSHPYYVRKRDGLSSSECRVTKRNIKWKHGISSMANPNTNKYGKHMNKRKKKFAYLWLIRGLEPHEAYMMAFKTISKTTAYKASVHLIKTEKTNLFNYIAMTYKHLFDSAGLRDEDIADIITREAKNGRTSKDRLEALKLALELRGEYSSGVKGVVNANTQQQLPPADAAQLTAPKMEIETTLVMKELPAPEPVEEAQVLSVEDTPKVKNDESTLAQNYAESLTKLGRWRANRRPSIRPRLKDFDSEGLRRRRSADQRDQAA